MGNNIALFGEEKIGRLLLRFSIPIIITYLVSELYNMVDTIFVGRNVGGLGIGGLVLVFPIQRLIIALSVMVAVGTSTAFSRANGQNNPDKARSVLVSGFSLLGLLMVTISGLIFIFSEKILLSLGSSREILPYGLEYLRIVILGSTFLSLTIFISNIMVSLGNNKASVINTSIGAIVNIILDYILIVRFNMGVMGAAIGTSLSQLIGFSYAYYTYRKIKRDYRIPSGIKLDKKIIIPILLVGLSSFVVEAEDGILMAVLNNLLVRSVGDTGLIILGVVSKVYMFLFIAMLGIASAMQPIAAYNMGAKNYNRIKLIMKKTLFYALMTSILMWIGSLVFAKQFVAIFIKDRAIIAESVRVFRIVISAFPLISIYYVSIFYFQAMGRAKTSIMVAVLRQLVIMLPLSIVLVKFFNMGAMGVWLSYPIADVLASVTSLSLMRSEETELNKMIQEKNILSLT